LLLGAAAPSSPRPLCPPRAGALTQSPFSPYARGRSLGLGLTERGSVDYHVGDPEAHPRHSQRLSAAGNVVGGLDIKHKMGDVEAFRVCEGLMHRWWRTRSRARESPPPRSARVHRIRSRRRPPASPAPRR